VALDVGPRSGKQRFKDGAGRSLVIAVFGWGGGRAECLLQERDADAFRAADIKNGHDVGVIETRDRLGFGQIGREIFLPGNHAVVGHLDRDHAVELIVVGPIHQAEAPLTNEFLDLVSPNLLGVPGVRHIGSTPGGGLRGARFVRQAMNRSPVGSDPRRNRFEINLDRSQRFVPQGLLELFAKRVDGEQLVV
jgi:hypothetical protein